MILRTYISPHFRVHIFQRRPIGSVRFRTGITGKKMSILLELKVTVFLRELELAMYPSVALFNTLLIAIGTAKDYQTTYRKCIDSILMIMDLLLAEQDQLKGAFLKHLFLSLMKRIGTIMYDNFILTRLNVYLLSAEAAFMLVTHTGVYEGAYLATLWFCHGKCFDCIRLLRFMDLKLECSLGTECFKLTSNFMTRLSNFDFKVVALNRGQKFFPEDLKYDVQSCVSGEFLMQSKS